MDVNIDPKEFNLDEELKLTFEKFHEDIFVYSVKVNLKSISFKRSTVNHAVKKFFLKYYEKYANIAEQDIAKFHKDRKNYKKMSKVFNRCVNFLYNVNIGYLIPMDYYFSNVGDALDDVNKNISAIILYLMERLSIIVIYCNEEDFRKLSRKPFKYENVSTMSSEKLLSMSSKLTLSYKYDRFTVGVYIGDKKLHDTSKNDLVFNLFGTKMLTRRTGTISFGDSVKQFELYFTRRLNIYFSIIKTFIRQYPYFFYSFLHNIIQVFSAPLTTINHVINSYSSFQRIYPSPSDLEKMGKMRIIYNDMLSYLNEIYLLENIQDKSKLDETFDKILSNLMMIMRKINDLKEFVEDNELYYSNKKHMEYTSNPILIANVFRVEGIRFLNEFVPIGGYLETGISDTFTTFYNGVKKSVIQYFISVLKIIRDNDDIVMDDESAFTKKVFTNCMDYLSPLPNIVLYMKYLLSNLLRIEKTRHYTKDFIHKILSLLLSYFVQRGEFSLKYDEKFIVSTKPFGEYGIFVNLISIHFQFLKDFIYHRDKINIKTPLFYNIEFISEKKHETPIVIPENPEFPSKITFPDINKFINILKGKGFEKPPSPEEKGKEKEEEDVDAWIRQFAEEKFPREPEESELLIRGLEEKEEDIDSWVKQFMEEDVPREPGEGPMKRKKTEMELSEKLKQKFPLTEEEIDKVIELGLLFSPEKRSKSEKRIYFQLLKDKKRFGI